MERNVNETECFKLYICIACWYISQVIMCLQPIDKQSFLDSGILCCLIHVLNALLAPDVGNQRLELKNDVGVIQADEKQDGETRAARLLEVVVLLVKTLPSI